MAEAGVRADPTLRAEHDTCSNGGIRTNPTSRADLRPGLHERERPNLG
jgi:hypothetical protein